MQQGVARKPKAETPCTCPTVSQNMTAARVAERVAALFLLCFVGFGGGIGRIFKIDRQPINANLTAYTMS